MNKLKKMVGKQPGGGGDPQDPKGNLKKKHAPNKLLVKDLPVAPGVHPHNVYLHPSRIGDLDPEAAENGVRFPPLGIYSNSYGLLRGKGNRTTYALVMAADEDTPELQCEPGEILMSPGVRLNLQVKINDPVFFYPREDDLNEAARVHILPFKSTAEGLTGDFYEGFLKSYFSTKMTDQRDENGNEVWESEGIPVKKGDVFIVNTNAAFRDAKFYVSEVQRGDGDPPPKKSKEAKDAAYVGNDTMVHTEGDPIDDDDWNALGVSYSDIGGVRKQLELIRQFIELPLRHPKIFKNLGTRPPKGVLLFGPPGSGKTLIARAVANETGAFFILINGPEIVSAVAGQSEEKLRKAFEEAEKNAPAIIFMDEVDSIGVKRERAGENEKRLTSQLLTLMDGMKKNSAVVVIGATNRPNSLDTALRRGGRFDKEIDIGIPDEEGRLEVLNIHTKHMKIDRESVDLQELAHKTHGFVGADLSALCADAAMQCIREKLDYFDMEEDEIDIEILSSMEVTSSHFDFAMKQSNPSSLRETVVEVPDVTWADIGGLEDVKNDLREMVQYPVEFPDLFEDYGMNPSRGVLFYGPPGCGKTLLAKAVANELQSNFISIKGPELLTMWFGQSEENVRGVFAKARGAAPCILFFDELDSIAKSRGQSAGDAGGSGDRVMNQLLTEMDGMESRKTVFIIGATNRPDIIDTALMRPGRLDQLVYIPIPDKGGRLSALKASLRKSPVASDVDLEYIASRTEGYSGADLASICQMAAKFAIAEDIQKRVSAKQLTGGAEADATPQQIPKGRIEKRHFEEAVRKSRRSISPQDLAKYKAFSDRLNMARGQLSSQGGGPGFSFPEGAAVNQEIEDDDLYN
eukprot:augustus_masked-scaffold_17-processed-gene-1.5-mRNA-1 protein AED:0.01 eAED:0.01 QI:0/-1/0/1/-1/1/1/0/857